MDNVLVLIIDDEQGIVNALTRLLKRHGYQIVSATGGLEGLKLLTDHDISVIICDQQMPGMSGHEVLSEAGKIAPSTQRIMLTGDSSSEAVMKAINEDNVSQFIQKPWDDAALVHSVRECVKNYNLESQNISLMKRVEEQNLVLKDFNKQLEGQVSERNFAMTDMVVVNKRTIGFLTKFKDDLELLIHAVAEEDETHSLQEVKEPLSYLLSEVNSFISENFD